MAEARMNRTDVWAVLENPLEADGGSMKVRHPILGILGPSEGDHREFIASRADGIHIPELLGQIDPIKVGKAELLSDNGFCVDLSPVGGIRKLGEQDSVFCAEASGLRIKGRHPLIITKRQLFAYQVEALNLYLE
jgi:hypothetical protein